MDERTRFRFSRRAVVLAGSAALLAILSAVGGAWYRSLSAHADPDYRPRVARAVFGPPAPLVFFDEGHRNVHKIAKTYAPFARLLGADGLRVRPLREPFSAASLAPARLLVIVNAKGPEGRDPESAFTPAEIDAIDAWVGRGGSLLLVADHTPFGAAAAPLARRFGVEMFDGEVFDETHSELGSGDRAQLVFDAAGDLLGDHPILSGRTTEERVERVVTFTGQALRAPKDATRLLRLPASAQDLPVLSIEMRESLFDWDRVTTFGEPVPTRGDCQALALVHGKGRVVVTGEAAFLTAQVRKGRAFGMARPYEGNQTFVLNTVRWLGGKLDHGAGRRF